MRHLRKFDLMTEYTNLYLPSTHPIPTMSLIEDSHKLMFESDEDMVPIEYLESTGAQWINTVDKYRNNWRPKHRDRNKV